MKSHFSRNKSKYKYLVYLSYFILSLSLALLIFSPIILFSYKFHDLQLSSKTVDWANFGAFFGGSYSALFSFASTVILCITLYLTQRNNNNQLAILNHEQTKNEIDFLVNTIEKRCEKKTVFWMGKHWTEKDIIEFMSKELSDKINTNHSGLCSMTELINYSIEIAKPHWKLYSDEIPMLDELVSIIYRQKNKQLRDLYKILSFERLDPERSYWMLAFAYNASHFIKICCKKDPLLLYPPTSYQYE
ncbi:hypothetical protein [Serratia marcescens]